MDKEAQLIWEAFVDESFRNRTPPNSEIRYVQDAIRELVDAVEYRDSNQALSVSRSVSNWMDDGTGQLLERLADLIADLLDTVAT